MCHSSQKTSDRCVKADCRSHWVFQNSTLPPKWQPHLRSQQIDNSRKGYREISWGAAAIFWSVISGYHRAFKVPPLFWEDGGHFSSEFSTAEPRENRAETISLPPLQLAPRTGLAQTGCPAAVYRVARTVGGGRQGLVNFLHEASLLLQLNKQTRKIRTDV